MPGSASRSVRAVYGFGPFVAEARTGLLRRDGRVVALTPKTFEVLLVLLARSPELVTKEELLAEVWPDAFVEENNLARHISTLRKALGEHLDDHRFVVTVPGRGYRFVADVADLTPPAPAASPENQSRIDSQSATPAGGPGNQSGIDFQAPLLPPVSLQTSPTMAGTARATPSSWSGLIVAALVVVAALAAAGVTWVARSERAAAPVAPARALRQLTFEPGLNAEPAFSSDGQWIAYAADDHGNADIWLHPVGGGDRIRVTSSAAHDWQPAWSPDGKLIAFRSERDGGGLFLVPAFGGDERRLTEVGFRPRWSPDGRSILFYDSALQSVRESAAAYVVDSAGGTPRPLPDASRARVGSLRASWHPDGRVSRWQFLTGTGWSFTTSRIDGSQSVTSAIAPDVERRLDEAGVVFDDFVWAPSGRAIYFEGTSNGVGNVWRITVDPGSLAWIAGPDRLTTGAGRDTGLAISADGTRMAFGMRTERTRIFTLPFDPRTGAITGAGSALSPESGDASYADVSASGDRLAYRMARPGNETVWEQPLPSGAPRLLISSPSGEGNALLRWSRDGSRLAMLRSRNGATMPAFRMRWTSLVGAASAQGLVREADGHETPIGIPGYEVAMVGDWSADGRRVLASCGSLTGAFALCLAPAPGSGADVASAREIASRAGTNVYQGRFSPDDRWVAFNAIASDSPWLSRIHVMRREGGAWIPITAGRAFDDKGRWSGDGRFLYYVSNRSGFLNVWRQRFDPDAGAIVGAPEQLTDFDSPGRMIAPAIGELELSVARDRLYLPLTSVSGQIWVLDQVDR